MNSSIIDICTAASAEHALMLLPTEAQIYLASHHPLVAPRNFHAW